MIYRFFFKRLFDIFGALLLMPIVLIICTIFGPIIYLEDRGPIFYKAIRRGKGGKPFHMYKLRSMKVNAPDIRNEDNSTYNAINDSRVTKIGKILRKTSVDELPQIFNVLKGDMSFIGPRPVTVDKVYNELDEVRKRRLIVRPGITGYSQAYFRNSISQEEKIRYDAEYAEKMDFVLDVKILIKTIDTVIRRKNIYNS